MLRLAIPALVATLIGTTTASAQILGYEGFEYPAGSALNGLNGGSGWSSQPAGAWSTTASTLTIGPGSLSPPAPADSLATNGNRLTLATTNAFTTASRTFGSDLRTVTGTPSVWISFVITRTAGDGASGAFGGVVIGNEAGSSNTTGRLFIGDSGAAPPTADTWSLERAGGGAIGVSNYVISNFPRVLLVANIQFNNSGADTVALYVNRPLGGGTPTSVDAFLNNLDINPSGGPVTDFGVGNGGGGGYEIDEIRIGASYASVTPAPEPGLALGLTAMGAIGIGVARLLYKGRSLSEPCRA